MKNEKKNMKKAKRFLTTLLAICMLLGTGCVFTSCSKAPSVEDIYDRVVELMEASHELNTVFYGAGLPIYERDSEYAEINHVYYGNNNDRYEMVTPSSKFLSEQQIREAAEKVFSEAYLEEVIYPLAFVGYAIKDGMGSQTFVYASYMEDGEWLYRYSEMDDYLKDGMRVYDYSTMEVISPSNADACYVTIDSWYPDEPDVIISERIRLVRQNDQWYIDSL